MYKPINMSKYYAIGQACYVEQFMSWLLDEDEFKPLAQGLYNMFKIPSLCDCPSLCLLLKYQPHHCLTVCAYFETCKLSSCARTLVNYLYEQLIILDMHTRLATI